jgi:RHO1 GDP-GTP exchange protein 1/2
LILTLILATLVFCPNYESYIKHYPLSEACHRTELKRNRPYQAFIQSCSLDPRIRKRDLITFLSRPVTRLPRLSLVLEQIKKLTDEGHEDLDNIPLILGILSDFIRSTQPGIEAAEAKVKFWSLCETLEYQKGEIIVCDRNPSFCTTLIHLSRIWTSMMIAAH